MSKKLDPKNVELFLLDNPSFFESRESLVSELNFKHSSSSAASLLERQVKKLREEHKNLISMLSSFMETASTNESLFNKSKDLILKILDSKTRDEIVNTVEACFVKEFKVDKCCMKFFKGKQLDDIENTIGLSLHKGAIHCGSLSAEKTETFFNDREIESMVIAVLVLKNEICLLMLGSFERTKYLGDEDTTFIEYIRDVLEKKLTQ